MTCHVEHNVLSSWYLLNKVSMTAFKYRINMNLLFVMVDLIFVFIIVVMARSQLRHTITSAQQVPHRTTNQPLVNKTYPKIRQFAPILAVFYPLLPGNPAITIQVDSLQHLPHDIVSLMLVDVLCLVVLEAVRAQDLVGRPSARVVVVVQGEEGCRVEACYVVFLYFMSVWFGVGEVNSGELGSRHGSGEGYCTGHVKRAPVAIDYGHLRRRRVGCRCDCEQIEGQEDV